MPDRFRSMSSNSLLIMSRSLLYGKASKGCTRWSPGHIDGDWKKVRRDPELFLVAEGDGAIVGPGVGDFDGRRALIHHLVVATPFRSQAIGSCLLNAFETKLQAKGCLKCYQMVTVDYPEAGKDCEQRGGYEMDTFRL
jgi:hypothetical protein